MNKYEVQCGGFVNTFIQKDGFVERFRHRKLIVSASNEEEAKEKASDLFVDLCQRKPGNMYTDDVNIDSITLIKKGK